MRIMTLVLSFGEEAYARQCDDIDIDITHIDMEHGFLVQWVYRECNLSRTPSSHACTARESAYAHSD